VEDVVRPGVAVGVGVGVLVLLFWQLDPLAFDSVFPSGHLEQLDLVAFASWPSAHIGQLERSLFLEVIPSAHFGQLEPVAFDSVPSGHNGQLFFAAFTYVTPSAHLGQLPFPFSASVIPSGHKAQFERSA
jgi:hypothetical protein